MTAKEFLGRITSLNRQLAAAKRKVTLYTALAENVTSSIGGEQVSHTRDVTANEKAIIRLTSSASAAYLPNINLAMLSNILSLR